MDIIEPYLVFARRGSQRPTYEHQVVTGPLAQLIRRTGGVAADRPLGDDFWGAVILEAVGQHPDDSVKITSVANQVAGQGNYSRRVDREAAKLRVFRLIGRLIRAGRLRRVARKYVALGTSPSRSENQPLERAQHFYDLPMPSV
jgi:hypothetical protein